MLLHHVATDAPTIPVASPRCSADEDICGWVLDMTGNQTLADLADVVIGKPLVVAAILLVAVVVRWFLHRVVDRIVRSAETPFVPDKVTARMQEIPLGRSAEGTASTDLTDSTRRAQRARTIGSLLKSVISGVIGAVAFTMILSEMGFNIAPIIASAGIVGVAIGFGAQTLVKDFLSGIFMIFEDQYGVGDVIRVNDIQGTVEAVTLRVTRLRDGNGTVWYIRNGEVTKVGNMSQNWARAVLDVTVSHEADLFHVRETLLDLATALWRDDEDFEGRIIEQPVVPGVESISAEGIVVRLSVKTAPMEQWAVARALRERIKVRFEAEGIVVPHTRYVSDETTASVESVTGSDD
ncbi:mechanosensitive ion channel family protein [Nocardioides yefusunii]|uniref:Mechanosensitive ion channel family protein n=1 Tax=Nocardioides yefusunii TaxID=2500546 RepID=A0ABW1QYG3_9ACTN|nr:mechanosensitive ion channel family protein [Nocardioides yefusunii]